MLRLFFQGLEQALGPALSTLASIVHGAGLVVLLAAALLPLYRRWVEYFAMGYGLQQVWVMTCQACGRTTRAAGHHCGYCDERLELPTMLKLWSGATRRRLSIRGQTARWWFHLVASVVFLLLSAWLIVSLNALEPAGSLHSLFVGAGLLAWASAGWFAGRAGRLAPIGPLGRLRDGALALTFVGFLAVTAFLADQAKPAAETVLVTFEAKPGQVEVKNRLVNTPTGEIVFEYLQLDHEVLGYHGIIPVAFTGSNRLPFPHSPLTVVLIRHLSANPDEYAARGLTVRFRSDRHRITPGYRYEIVDRVGQALIRRVARSSVDGDGTA